jgi:hypothetical protein
MLQPYSSFKPTAFDRNIDIDRNDWLIAPCSRNRDSEPLQKSNWEIQKAEFELLSDEGENWEIHRFGHWANGWFEIIIVKPGTKQEKLAEDLARSLADYPVLDESHYSEIESAEALEVWENCYDTHERIEYIRNNREQFYFHDWKDLLECVRGKYFSGYASELLA